MLVFSAFCYLSPIHVIQLGYLVEYRILLFESPLRVVHGRNSPITCIQVGTACQRMEPGLRMEFPRSDVVQKPAGQDMTWWEFVGWEQPLFDNKLCHCLV